jgi:hypothetical protein
MNFSRANTSVRKKKNGYADFIIINLLYLAFRTSANVKTRPGSAAAIEMSCDEPRRSAAPLKMPLQQRPGASSRRMSAPALLRMLRARLKLAPPVWKRRPGPYAKSWPRWPRL